MQFIDWLLIAAIVLAVFFAVRHIRKKRGACCGDCASCSKSCAQREHDNK